MHPFGGTQLCPRCSKPVYAAEQIMGPGRKLYHRPCLSCMTCKKRLDSYSLVEHDQEPYCKSCYTKNFSTRDLRQANLPVRETSVSPTPASPPKTLKSASVARSFPPPMSSPVLQSNTSSTSLLPQLKPAHSPSGPTSPISPESVQFRLGAALELHTNTVGNEPTPGAEKILDTPLTDAPPLSPPQKLVVSPPGSSSNQSSKATGPLTSISASTDNSKHLPSTPTLTYAKNNNTASAALELLEKEGINPLVQTTTGTRYGTALGGKVTMNMTGAHTGGSPRKWATTTPLCPRCSQRVYFAEQVKAVGQTWHKNCLRCRECNTALDSNRLRDHDGVPFCVRCYSKLHGPQGSGYALLGKAGS